MTNSTEAIRVSDERLSEMQRDCGIPNPPTQETYWFRKALAGEGPHAYDWSDKPHRLIFGLCRLIEADAAIRSKAVAGVSVKPLVWKRRTEGGVWRAETLIGEYRVWTHHEADGAWFWNLTGGATTKSDKCLSEDAAKVAAEADYRQRILSALSASEQEPVAWLSPCISGPYKGQFEVENAKPDRPPFNQMWGDWFPVYASSQPEVVITEDMVERVMSWLREDVLPAYGITHNNRASDPEMIEGCRAALTAALKES